MLIWIKLFSLKILCYCFMNWNYFKLTSLNTLSCSIIGWINIDYCKQIDNLESPCETWHFSCPFVLMFSIYSLNNFTSTFITLESDFKIFKSNLHAFKFSLSICKSYPKIFKFIPKISFKLVSIYIIFSSLTRLFNLSWTCTNWDSKLSLDSF